MRREDCVDLFQKIPESSHAQVNLVLHNQAMLTVDVIARFEPTYLVFRGREGGSTDEGRAFFVPYEEIAYLRIDKVVRVGELKRMFGETGYVDSEDRLGGEEQGTSTDADAKPDLDVTTPQSTPTPISLPMDPAAIAKQNLLDRIRAARANVAGTTGKFDRK
ncbi:MAG: hypothetical protein L0241_10845 [Planctomycetia bacterium]|nr:hypothetical protein [Planctomycetia bacterium]